MAALNIEAPAPAARFMARAPTLMGVCVCVCIQTKSTLVNTRTLEGVKANVQKYFARAHTHGLFEKSARLDVSRAAAAAASTAAAARAQSILFDYPYFMLSFSL